MKIEYTSHALGLPMLEIFVDAYKRRPIGSEKEADNIRRQAWDYLYVCDVESTDALLNEAAPLFRRASRVLRKTPAPKRVRARAFVKYAARELEVFADMLTRYANRGGQLFSREESQRLDAISRKYDRRCAA